MKISRLVLSILFIPLINANLTANAYPTGTSADLPAVIHSSDLQQGIIDNLQKSLDQQKQQNEKQHAQDLQIISFLLALSIGLACVVVALALVFLKNRRSLDKGIL